MSRLTGSDLSFGVAKALKYDFLSGGLNFNNFTTTGIYWCNITQATSINYPTTSNGVLLVFADSAETDFVQVYIERPTGTMYTRAKRSDTSWSAWNTVSFAS